MAEFSRQNVLGTGSRMCKGSKVETSLVYSKVRKMTMMARAWKYRGRVMSLGVGKVGRSDVPQSLVGPC